MKRQMVVLLVGGFAFLGAAVAIAHGPGGMGRGGRMEMGMGMGFGPHMAAELGLSADQQKQIDTLHTQLRAEMAPLMTQIETKQGELTALWKVDAPDRNAILAKVSEIDSLHDQMRAAFIDFRLTVHQLLTPAQRAKAATLMSGPGGHGMGPHGMGLPADGTCPCANPENK